MVQTIQNFAVFDKKWLTIFDKVLTPLEDVTKKTCLQKTSEIFELLTATFNLVTGVRLL